MHNMVHDINLMQVGQPSEDCENDHDGKPGSSKLAMGLKMAAAGAELAVAGAELVETLGRPMFIVLFKLAMLYQSKSKQNSYWSSTIKLSAKNPKKPCDFYYAYSAV